MEWGYTWSLMAQSELVNQEKLTTLFVEDQLVDCKTRAYPKFGAVLDATKIDKCKEAGTAT